MSLSSTTRARAAFLALGVAAAVPCLHPVDEAVAQTKKSEKTDKPRASRPADIDRNGVLILVRGAITALDHANKTGNYTVLRDLGAPGFQVNTAARLGEIFSSQRQQELDLAGIAVLEPQLTLLPRIEPSGMLHMAGFFPSVPVQVNFELLFAPVDRKWKLFGISVNIAKNGPQAPDAPPGPEPRISEELPDPPTPNIGPKPEAKP
jgi:hypothetical protein